MPRVQLTLLDRQRLLTPQLTADYAACGWAVTAQVADALDWAAEGEQARQQHAGGAAAAAPAAAEPRWDLIVANLFLHHFSPEPLARLLAAAAVRADHFIACEPRRGRLALAGSHLIGALGVNAVTRADAVSSVHAGFAGAELSALWPAANSAPGWSLREYPAGLFSHCLTASRGGGGASAVPHVNR